MDYIIVGLLIISLWLLVLTGYFFYSLGKIKQLYSHSDTGKLDEHQKLLGTMAEQISKMRKAGASYVQRVGLVRFNPFQDVGGDQSFSLALLDGDGNGVVISSLHSRAVTRTYAKPIIGGKSLRHDLSQEEERAIAQAIEEKIK